MILDKYLNYSEGKYSIKPTIVLDTSHIQRLKSKLYKEKSNQEFTEFYMKDK